MSNMTSLIRGCNCLLFTSTWVVVSFWWVRVAQLYQFSVLCFPCLTLHEYLGSSRFLVDLCCSSLLVFCAVFCLSYSSRVPGFSQVFRRSVLLIFISFLCCVLCVYVLYLVCPMLPVFLDCLFCVPFRVSLTFIQYVVLTIKGF